MKKAILARRWAALALVVPVLLALGCGTTTAKPPQEQIIFSSNRALDGSDGVNVNSTQNIWVVNFDGTGAKPLTLLTAGVSGSYNPVWSPDGTRIAFSSWRAPDGTDAPNARESANIWVMIADGTGAKPLTAFTWGFTVSDYAAWSPDGTRIAFREQRSSKICSALADIVNADGTGQMQIDNCLGGDGPVWSPDGTKLAYSAHRAPGGVGLSVLNIWLAHMDGTGWTDLTPVNSASSVHPAWSPDGTKIAFASGRALDGSDAAGRVANVWVVNADGSGARPLTTFTSGGGSDKPSWSPDGTKIMFISTRALDGSDAGNTNATANVWIMNADGSGAKSLTLLTALGAGTSNAVWSPDGTKIAFDSARALDGSDAASTNGITNIWVMNADGTSAKPLAPVTAANTYSGTPRWHP